MTPELETLRDIAGLLESAGIDYMLTGSMALNCYATPRMTRDVDFVVAFLLKDADGIEALLGGDYYVSGDAAREAVLHQSSFNAINHATMIKVDLMIRKREEYRLHEFSRRRRLAIEDFEAWVVSKEDLILSKLHWAKDSLSVRQMADVQNLLATGCDMDYIREWSIKLNLTGILTRVSP